MRNPHSLFGQVVNGGVDRLAEIMEVGPGRMYEILDKDNPLPKTKRLIRAIAQVNPDGIKLIKADMDALFDELMNGKKEVTTADLHQEAADVVNALLTGKGNEVCKKELRELIAIATQKLTSLG